jgi:hypothetical protein
MAFAENPFVTSTSIPTTSVWNLTKKTYK